MTDKRSVDKSLAEIHYEISELLHKQTNGTKREFEKITSEVRSHKLPQAHEKVCDENERNKENKNDVRIKMFLMEGGSL